MNVILVDDHALVRAGICTLINQIDGFTVIGEASDGLDAMELVRQTRPDIVVTDITLGDENGLDLLPRIELESPRTRVVILSMHASEELVAEALRRGASAYLLKESAPNELEIALQAVVRDGNYLSPAVSKKVIDRFVRPPAAEEKPVADKPLDILTARQQQILTMIASRKSTKEIAYELDLSEKTIAAHRAQIMERVGVRDLVGLVLWAVKHGLVQKAD
jgi:DNA-binding NarL/FixJ family response regulator